ESHSLRDPLIIFEGEENSKINSHDTSIWSSLTFHWVSPLMDLGLKKQISFNDLFQLPNELDPLACHNALKKHWIDEERKSAGKPSLFRAIYHTYGWPYLWIGILKAINDGLGFMGPLLLNALIHSLQQDSENGQHFGFYCAFGLGVLSVSRAFLGAWYTFLLSKLKLQLRASIITILYQKCLSISLSERTIFSTGEIQTLMSVDADRAVNLCSSFHDIWSLPLQMGISLFLLYTQVKFAFLAGLTVIILLIPVNRWIAGKISTANQLMMKQKDERVRKAGELLMYIRTLKMHTWEHYFADRLKETREHEVKHLATRKYLDAWCVYFWATTPTLFSLFTFGLYALLGYSLDAATVFTCLSLFNMLISPLNSFPWVINGLIEAFISLQRLGKFLSCTELNSCSIKNDAAESYRGDACHSNSCKENSYKDVQHMALIVQNAECVWSNSQQEHQNPILKQISLKFPKGWLTVIIGQVGSGKSSLLSAILGEMRFIKGNISRQGSVAYVPQAPWIQSATVRDNILFGKEYDGDRYAEVLRACALDLDIHYMKGGDRAMIGEKGFNLSGGQRARLALARALYQDSDIYLLDDTLSAVDAHVAAWILQNAIGGSMMAHKTRILCTHNTQAIHLANMIIVMEKGTVKWAGCPTEFHSSFIHPLHHEMNNASVNNINPNGQTSQNKSEIEIQPVFERHENMDLCSSECTSEIFEEEERKEGRVQYHVYRNYAAFAGWLVVMTILIATFLMQLSRNGNDFWLSHWVDSTLKNPYDLQSTSFFLGVLTAIATCNSFFTLVRAFSFAFGGLRTAIHVHNILLNKVVNAPVSFFDRNPQGRILNRFSSDQYMIDDSLPFISNILLANFFSLIGIIVVLCLVQWAFLLLLFPLGYIYSKLQQYYRATSRELRRLDSVSRSPIYTSFTEALDGAPTIRAFSRQPFFASTNHKHVTLNQQASYSELAASLWLSIRLQLLAAFVISFISIMAVLGRYKRLPFNSGTAGLVGLALSYAIPIISLLNGLLTSFTETEKEMISVERVEQYMEVVPEEMEGNLCADQNWPKEGHVEFNKVTLRYMPFLPPALQAVSFSIRAGEQVGIAGRTGAGKSSILNALFRLTPLSDGKIFIDNVDIANVSLKELRSRLTIVPQTPFLFEGTLRENLDPFSNSTDSTLWEILQKCHMKEAVISNGGIDSHVTEEGECFSTGQRQLLCLARALLKSSKLLCLDECTANIDPQTTLVIKDTVAKECKGMTVITIAHRITTISNMDRVLIFDQGNIVEDGNPQALLQDDSSKTIHLSGKPDFWPRAAEEHIRTLCSEEVAIGGLDHWEKKRSRARKSPCRIERIFGKQRIQSAMGKIEAVGKVEILYLPSRTKIGKAMAKGDEKKNTTESCITSKLANIADIDLGPEPLSELIDRSRVGKTSLMRAVKSSGIIRVATFPCTAQLPKFVMECTRSYHLSFRAVRDATGKTIIRLDAEFINCCLKIPVRKMVTSISIQDVGISQGVFSKLDRCGVLSKDPIFECYPQLIVHACEKDFKVVNNEFFYDFIYRLDKDLKANRVSKGAWGVVSKVGSLIIQFANKTYLKVTGFSGEPAKLPRYPNDRLITIELSRQLVELHDLQSKRHKSVGFFPITVGHYSCHSIHRAWGMETQMFFEYEQEFFPAPLNFDLFGVARKTISQEYAHVPSLEDF
ncbi:hypothetical protein KI387_008030, partial [Taxus chinensis]